MTCLTAAGEVVHCYPVKSILHIVSPADQSSHMSFRWQDFLHALPSTTVLSSTKEATLTSFCGMSQISSREATLTLLLKTFYFSLKPQCFFTRQEASQNLTACSTFPNKTTVFYVVATQTLLLKISSQI